MPTYEYMQRYYTEGGKLIIEEVMWNDPDAIDIAASTGKVGTSSAHAQNGNGNRRQERPVRIYVRSRAAIASRSAARPPSKARRTAQRAEACKRQPVSCRPPRGMLGQLHDWQTMASCTMGGHVPFHTHHKGMGPLNSGLDHVHMSA